uniref:recombinase family protein n=1 Tax=Altererythrobacter segetis TaxID=1104773 RepID=UPI001409EABC|nr:recombinase family protein [Altererythrobacter segetis]
MTVKTIRCAIYTRKSSDEGLDQSFNSLDAQREAGEAYVKSQASEGWTVIPALYDDGGFSGGTMERPGLQRLLADIEAGLVDVVVVYKIDRLTRSLSDFSRIVEVFEKAGASFVSVTQSFNTTNSMGRLMLNVLLSFAQFEREVTGERIRDKIAASKAKGMWMGGTLPLGYDLPAAGTRTLQVNKSEAATVRHIFARYLELGSVHALQRELADQGIRPKQRVTANGKTLGGDAFSRGALFHLLRNRIYLGQIVHREAVHQGEHEAIVDEDLFKRVQRILDGNARRHRAEAEHRIARAPLTGKLFDATGEPMCPTFSRGKSGRSYRYYVSASLQQGAASSDGGVIRRLSAQAIERVVTEVAERLLDTSERQLDKIMAVRLVSDGLVVDLPGGRAADLGLRLSDEETIVHAASKVVRIHVPLALPLRGGRPLVLTGATRSARPDPALITALRKAHRMLEREGGMPVVKSSPLSLYDRQILRLAFLAPELQRDILAGRQPPMLNLEKLKSIAIPLAWNGQKAALGWPT